MRLAAFQGSLTNLRVRADELHISESDRLVIDDLLLTLSGLQWSQLSSAAIAVTHRRRSLALEALGVQERDMPSLLRAVPPRGPYLFGGQFASVFQREIEAR